MARSETMSAAALARTISRRIGRTVTDKQVRAMARTIVGDYDKVAHPAYQRHAYSAAVAKRLTDAFIARSQGKPVAAPSKPKTRKPRVAKPTSAPDA